MIVGAILLNSDLIFLCLLTSAMIKSGFNLLITSIFGCGLDPTDSYAPILSLTDFVIFLVLPSSAIPTGFISNAAK